MAYSRAEPVNVDELPETDAGAFAVATIPESTEDSIRQYLIYLEMGGDPIDELDELLRANGIPVDAPASSGNGQEPEDAPSAVTSGEERTQDS